MQHTLRFATQADIPALTNLINEAFVVESFFKIGDRITQGEVLEFLAAGKFLLLENNEELIGAVYAKVTGDRGYMGTLSVSPRHQRQGIGSRLIFAAEEFCREQGCLWMDISVVNLRTELPPLYEKYGYRVIGTAPFPFMEKASQACEFVLMEKPLPSNR